MKVPSISCKNAGYVWLGATVAICLIMTYVVYADVLTLQLERKETIANQLASDKSRVAAVEQFAAEHPDLDSYLQQMDTEVIRVNKLLPDRANMGETLVFLEDSARNTGVACGALTTEKSVYKNGWTESRLVFKVLGAYSDLLEFAQCLDNGPRFMAVQAIEFHDRLMPKQLIGDEATRQKKLEQELSGKADILVKPILERGLLNKPSLVVMNVYLMVATEGRLPEVDDVSKEEKKPAQAKPAQPAKS
ncbi:MAG: Pilus assembly protein, PilO [Firmicutes bacterium]|nr:Pilus assembly protein, PilO [Bacillota bacterium]